MDPRSTLSASASRSDFSSGDCHVASENQSHNSIGSRARQAVAHRARTGAPAPARLPPDRPCPVPAPSSDRENSSPSRSRCRRETDARASNLLRPPASAFFPAANPRCETARSRSACCRDFSSQSHFATAPIPPAVPDRHVALNHHRVAVGHSHSRWIRGAQRSGRDLGGECCAVVKLHSVTQSKLPALIARRGLPRSGQRRLHAPVVVRRHQRVEHQHSQTASSERIRLRAVRRIERRRRRAHGHVQRAAVLRTRFRVRRQRHNNRLLTASQRQTKSFIAPCLSISRHRDCRVALRFRPQRGNGARKINGRTHRHRIAIGKLIRPHRIVRLISRNSSPAPASPRRTPSSRWPDRCPSRAWPPGR